MAIQAGTLLECTTAGSGTVVMRALGPVVPGADFPVVWVCVPEDEGNHGIPWPLSAVRELSS